MVRICTIGRSNYYAINHFYAQQIKHFLKVFICLDLCYLRFCSGLGCPGRLFNGMNTFVMDKV
jgi:hypothetical protein